MSYKRHTWECGETITAELMNNLEGGQRKLLSAVAVQRILNRLGRIFPLMGNRLGLVFMGNSADTILLHLLISTKTQKRMTRLLSTMWRVGQKTPIHYLHPCMTFVSLFLRARYLTCLAWATNLLSLHCGYQRQTQPHSSCKTTMA